MDTRRLHSIIVGRVKKSNSELLTCPKDLYSVKVFWTCEKFAVALFYSTYIYICMFYIYIYMYMYVLYIYICMFVCMLEEDLTIYS